MIFEHEIPSGSRLYFGESARLKRSIENGAAELLEQRGYKEIVTPLFSYHQHESFEDTSKLVRLNDAQNHEVSLRADSTADVVRIATKRLSRSMDSARWYYIQPVYEFPTRERYQIGAESLDGELTDVCGVCIELLRAQRIEPVLQIANIAIPKLLSDKYGIALEDMKSVNIEKILDSGHEWMESLLRIHSVEDMRDLGLFPDDIASELAILEKTARSIGYANTVISPLYYAKLRYYDSLLFRMFEGNSLYAMGGSYIIESTKAAGFAIYVDACVAKKMEKDTHAQ